MSPLAGRPLADRWMGGLDRRDRTLLIVCGLLIVTIIVAIAIFSPPGKGQEATTPFSYSTDRHGAKAAFELLTKAGHKVERQNAPLSEIIDRVDQHTTLVIAEPYLQYVLDNRDVLKQALDRGARVLVTGASGALLVPGNALDQRTQMQADCQAEPNGFGDIANSGKVEMGAPVYWQRDQPLQRVEYTCDGGPVVVTYTSGKGEVVWWASSFPLENAGIVRADNLVLFLNSVGPASNHVIWDESLHGDLRSLWSYAGGTPVHLLWGQLALVALLLLFSYSRRKGPLRPDPGRLPRCPYRVCAFPGDAVSEGRRDECSRGHCLPAISPQAGNAVRHWTVTRGATPGFGPGPDEHFCRTRRRDSETPARMRKCGKRRKFASARSARPGAGAARLRG